jgi:hypothetical protein
MALQTQTTSAEPEPSKTQTRTDDPFLTSDGSPPLILGFLAFGVFFLALFMKYGYSRMGPRIRGRVVLAGNEARNRKADKDLGSKPRLWELRSNGPEEVDRLERMVVSGKARQNLYTKSSEIPSRSHSLQ